MSIWNRIFFLTEYANMLWYIHLCILYCHRHYLNNLAIDLVPSGRSNAKTILKICAVNYSSPLHCSCAVINSPKVFAMSDFITKQVLFCHVADRLAKSITVIEVSVGVINLKSQLNIPNWLFVWLGFTATYNPSLDLRTMRSVFSN